MTERAERVLFVHAHPDDETITTGATIATLVERGAEVIVLTCTRGELGEVIPPELRHLTGAALGAVRETELAAALAALGVSEHRILGQPGARWADRPPRRYLDSGMRWVPKGAAALESVDRASLTAADAGEVAADIAAVMIAFQPDLVVSYAADGGYGHPDHIRTHEATRTAAEVLRVPFYVVDSPGARPGPVSVTPTGAVLERKRAALTAHRTQVAVEGESFSLSSGEPRPIAVAETLTRVRPVGSSFRDHGLVSRIAALALSTVIGGVAGATLTIVHQASVPVGGVTVPWGIISALLITSALLLGLRLVFQTRLVAMFATVGLLAVSAALAAQSVGGSVLVPANPAGYVWTFAPVVIAGVVLGWPRLVRREQASGGGNIEVPAVKGPDLP